MITIIFTYMYTVYFIFVQVASATATNFGLSRGLMGLQYDQINASESEPESCECKKITFAANSPEMIRLTGRMTEKVRPFKWLRMLPNFLRIPTNFLRSLRSVCRISCESFAKVKNTYECLTITTHALPQIRLSCDAYENVTKTIRIWFPSEF